MLNRLMTRFTDDEGATALEYGVLVALIALVITAGVGAFGTQLNAFFNGIAGRVPFGGG